MALKTSPLSHDLYARSNFTTPMLGWVSQPDTRGTLDIVWSCASTIFVCAWVMLHLNVPAQKDSQIVRFTRKVKWFIVTLVQPEMILMFAFGQWSSARRSCREMKEIGLAGWTLTHAFYAESGGFMLRATAYPPFPVNAKQMAYLFRNGYIDHPSITRDEIWDKSKADYFAKGIALIQSAWFVAQAVARGVSHLPMSLLELVTLATMSCSGMTMCFWFYKPLNVEIPTIIDSKVSIEKILLDAGDAAETQWRDTPLDFADPIGYISLQMPFRKVWTEMERPLPRMPNDRDHKLHSWRCMVILGIPWAIFGVFQFIAWNFHFPTTIERLLWRYTTVIGCVLNATFSTVETIGVIASGFTTTNLHNFKSYKLRFPWGLLCIVPGVLYGLTRLFAIVEVLISLRSQEAGCYQQVQWTSILPHI